MTEVDAQAAFRAAEERLLRKNGLDVEEIVAPLNKAGGSVRILSAGAGTGTLYVHGGGAFGAIWAPLAGHIEGRRSVMPDRPGFGLSSYVPLRGEDFRRHAVAFS